ncbi:MAG: hypothetical protein NC215_00375 [Ruminococcus sp.]|nr:hypothetical protein [Ruminococcus sp.]
MYNRLPAVPVDYQGYYQFINSQAPSYYYLPRIKKVIFNYPATIVIWEDNTKTVVKVHDESFDPEKGLAMAIAKKAFGNEFEFHKVFKEHIKLSDEELTPKSIQDVVARIVKAATNVLANFKSRIRLLEQISIWAKPYQRLTDPEWRKDRTVQYGYIYKRLAMLEDIVQEAERENQCP